MPIVFAPAEPIRPDISTGYGASQQWTQDAPMLQRQQQGIAEAYLQSAALQQRAAQASQQMQLQAHEHMAGLDQQQANQQAHFTLAQQQMGHQSDMQSQHANLQDQLAANQLTRSETMRLERMRNAQADIMANPDLSDEDKHNAVMLLRTGIDSYTQRQHRAQQQHVELQNQQLQRQTAAFDNLERERTAFRNSSFESRVVRETDADGVDHESVLGLDGNVDHHATALRLQQRGGRTRNQGAGGGEGGETAPRALAPQQTAAIHHAIHQEMHQAGTAPAGGWTDAHPMPAWAAGGAQSAAWSAEYARRLGERTPAQTAPEDRMPDEAQVRRQVWQAIMSNPATASLPLATRQQMRDTGIANAMTAAAAPIAERRQANAEVDRTVAAAPEWARQMVSNPADRARMQGAALTGLRSRAAAERGELPPNARPQLPELATPQGRREVERLSDTDFLSRVAANRESMPVGQQRQMDRFDTLRTLAESAPEGERAQLTEDATRAQRLWVTYGSVDAMPPREASLFRRRMLALDALTPQRQTQAAAPPSQPAVTFGPERSSTPDFRPRVRVGTSGGRPGTDYVLDVEQPFRALGSWWEQYRRNREAAAAAREQR